MFSQNTEPLLKNPASILMISPFMKEAKLEMNSRPGASFFSYYNNNPILEEEQAPLKKEPAGNTKKNKKLNNLLICKQNFKNFWIRAEKWKNENNVHDNEVIEKFNLQKINFSKIPTAEEMLEIYEEMMSREIQKKKKKNWSHQELCLFLWVCFNYAVVNSSGFEDLSDKDWENLSGMFFSISPEECKYRFFDLLKSKTQKQAWTDDEDKVLLQLVLSKSEYSLKKSFKWKEIAKELNETLGGESFRLAKQCRERWFNHLDPDLNKGEWKSEEDYTLIERVMTIGKKWSKIAKYLRGRNENSVKNRFYSLQRKYRQQVEDAEKKSQADRLSEHDSFLLILNEICKHLSPDFLSSYEKKCMLDPSESASRNRETSSATENNEEKSISSEDFGDTSPSISKARDEVTTKSMDSTKASLVAGYKSYGQSGATKPSFELISRNIGSNNKKERNSEPLNSDEELSFNESSGKMIEEQTSSIKNKLGKSQCIPANTTNTISQSNITKMEMNNPIYDINKSASLTKILENEAFNYLNPSQNFNNNLRYQYMTMVQNNQPLFSNAFSQLFNPYNNPSNEVMNAISVLNNFNYQQKNNFDSAIESSNYGGANQNLTVSDSVTRNKGNVQEAGNERNMGNYQNNFAMINSNQDPNFLGQMSLGLGFNPFLINNIQNNQNFSLGGYSAPNNFYNPGALNPSVQQLRPGFGGASESKNGNFSNSLSSNLNQANNQTSLQSNQILQSGNSMNLPNFSGQLNSSASKSFLQNQNVDVFNEPPMIEPIKFSAASLNDHDCKSKNSNLPSPGLESQLAKHRNSAYSDDELEKFFDCYENMIVSESISDNLQNSLRNFKGSSLSSGKSLGASNFNSGNSHSHLIRHQEKSFSIDEKDEFPNSNENIASIEHINFNNSCNSLILPNNQGNSMDCESSSEGEQKITETNNPGGVHPTILGSHIQMNKPKKSLYSPKKRPTNENLPFLNIIKEEIHTSDSSRSFRQESSTDTDNIEALLPESCTFNQSIDELGKIIKSTNENPEISGAIDLLLDQKTPSIFPNSLLNSHSFDHYYPDSRNMSLRTISKPSLDNDRLLSPALGSTNLTTNSPFNFPLSVNSLQHLATPNDEYRRILQISPSPYGLFTDNRFDQYLKFSGAKRNPSSDNLN